MTCPIHHLETCNMCPGFSAEAKRRRGQSSTSVVDESKPHGSVVLTGNDITIAVLEFLNRRGDVPNGTYNSSLCLTNGTWRFMWQTEEQKR